jgi:hypothetical protein
VWNYHIGLFRDTHFRKHADFEQAGMGESDGGQMVDKDGNSLAAYPTDQRVALCCDE